MDGLKQDGKRCAYCGVVYATGDQPATEKFHSEECRINWRILIQVVPKYAPEIGLLNKVEIKNWIATLSKSTKDCIVALYLSRKELERKAKSKAAVLKNLREEISLIRSEIKREKRRKKIQDNLPHN